MRGLDGILLPAESRDAVVVTPTGSGGCPAAQREAIAAPAPAAMKWRLFITSPDARLSSLYHCGREDRTRRPRAGRAPSSQQSNHVRFECPKLESDASSFTKKT